MLLLHNFPLQQINKQIMNRKKIKKYTTVPTEGDEAGSEGRRRKGLGERPNDVESQRHQRSAHQRTSLTKGHIKKW